MSGRLTDPEFVRRLERLYLLARKVLGGSLQSDRRSMHKGSGITFAEHAEYATGDDHRAIDWRVYARSEALVIKLFEREEDIPVHLLVDGSASMRRKSDAATELAAALGYIALHSMDEVAVWSIGELLEPIVRPVRGRGRTLPMLRALEEFEPRAHASDFGRCAATLQGRQRRRALIVVLSDFLFPGGFAEGLRRLRWSGHDVFAIRIQDEADRTCSALGDVELACIESGAQRRITLTPSRIAAYEDAVRHWNESLDTECARQGIGLVSTTPDTPFEEIVRGILRRGGLVA